MHALKLVLRHNYWLKLGLVGFLVALADWMFWQQELGIGNFGLYGGGLLLALILVRPATIKTLAGKLTIAATGFYTFATFIDASVLSLALFWIAVSVAALLPFSSQLKDGWHWLGRLIIHGLAACLKPLNDAARVKKIKGRRASAAKFTLRAALSLLALPLIGGAAFFALFVQANPILERLVASWQLPNLDYDLIFRMIIWTIAGTMIWSLFRPWRLKGGVKKPQEMQAAIGFPLPSLASITLSLVVFNGLFLMQNSMDLAFMSGLVALPDTMTLAQYAHRGAYPLIGTALLAGLFVLVVLKPGGIAANDRLARILVVIWIVQNVVLVASSMIRTWDYVEVYSLTRLRISALVWMALVGVGLALICWRLLTAKSGSWLINANLWTSGIVLTAFCLIDTGAIAARWNVTHAKEVGGRGAALDLCHMQSFGAGAIAPLMSLEQSNLPATFLTRVKAVRTDIQADEQRWLENRGWTWRRAQRLATAKAQEATLPPRDIGRAWRDCSGNLEQVLTPVIPPHARPQPLLTPSVTP